MRKNLIALAILPAFCANPAFCAPNAADEVDETVSVPAKIPAKTESKPKPAGKPAKKSSKKSSKGTSNVGENVGKASKRAAAVATGFSLGMPIAIVRMILRSDAEQAQGVPFIGESKNPALVGLSRMIVIPTAVFSGTVQAPVYDAMNAWQQSDDKPFSKESFFLGDIDDMVPQ